jgi:hypothetical protein
MLACCFAALVAAETPAMGEEAKIKTTAELIAEVEGSAEPATATPVVDSKAVKTTAELIAEVEAESKPSPKPPSKAATAIPGVADKTVKTTAELIAEVEAASKPSSKTPSETATETAVDEKAPKSAAEILAEIEALSRPSRPASAAIDQEPVASTTHTASATQVASDSQIVSDTEEELPLDTDPLPDEVIGEYAVDDSESASGTEFIVVSEVEDISDPTTGVASATDAQSEEPVEKLYEKADALEPQLMIAGTPAEEESATQVSEKLNGRIIAEKHPLNRRRHMYRWVLKTADGLRIPLKSNIKLLQEVRRDEVLDSAVSATGRFIQSGFNDNLRYFVVESVVVLDKESTDEKPAKADGKKTATAGKKSNPGSKKSIAGIARTDQDDKKTFTEGRKSELSNENAIESSNKSESISKKAAASNN